MGAFFSFAYGSVAYVSFLATFLYAIGFVGNMFVPKSIDSGVPTVLAHALIVDLLLLSLFAVQHSVMARRSFKAWWTRIVSPTVERSTFVFLSSLCLALLCWQWQPIPTPVVWSLRSGTAAHIVSAIFWLGWGVLLISSFLINHFELFGLSQAAGRLTGSEPPKPQFRTPLFYRYVRHPIYLGFLLGFWATPVMTAGHLLFSIGATGYILVGIWLEERDLIAQFGEQYRHYRTQVGMLIPSRRVY